MADYRFCGQYVSPYLGMGNNPMNGTDPDSGVYNPVYDKNREYLGTTASGFTREALFSDSKDFTQGMSDKIAFSKGTFLNEFKGFNSLFDRAKIEEHIVNFKLKDVLNINSHVSIFPVVGMKANYNTDTKDNIIIFKGNNTDN